MLLTKTLKGNNCHTSHFTVEQLSDEHLSVLMHTHAHTCTQTHTHTHTHIAKHINI